MKKLQQIIEKTENGYLPLQRTAAEASWKGSIYGDEAEFARQAEASKALTALFSDKETFQELKALKESGKVTDPILKRELDVYYSQFLSNQADTALLNQIIERETALDQKFSAYRATYKGKQVSDNEVVSILRESTNNADLEEIWKAHKAIGREVAEDMLEIVR
ncbi:MAG: M2 family metallopeptidase, partial [Bacteroidales bacterium]|nr:M2 family metallopeptidase [Bacteroidales bacterium]